MFSKQHHNIYIYIYIPRVRLLTFTHKISTYSLYVVLMTKSCFFNCLQLQVWDFWGEHAAKSFFFFHCFLAYRRQAYAFLFLSPILCLWCWRYFSILAWWNLINLSLESNTIKSIYSRSLDELHIDFTLTKFKLG